MIINHLIRIEARESILREIPASNIQECVEHKKSKILSKMVS